MDDITLLIDTLSVVAVGVGLLHARYLAKGRIYYILPLISGLCVAFLDWYAAVTQPELRSFVLFAWAALAQVFYACLGWWRWGKRL